MEAPSTGSTPLIALRSFKAGGRQYEGGDHFDPATAERDGLSNYNIENLRKQRYTAPLSRTEYSIAIGRRPPGSIGKGFKPEWLKEQGIIDEIPKVVSKPTTIAAAPATGESVDYRGCKIVPIKQGHFTRYEALDSDGKAMRAKRFQKLEGAKAFIDEVLGEVVAAPEHVDAAAASEAEKAGDEEHGDGSDVQSGSGGPDLQSPD